MHTKPDIMNDFCNVVFLWFRDVTKQYGCNSVGALYAKPLGEIVIHYDNTYKIKKTTEYSKIKCI